MAVASHQCIFALSLVVLNACGLAGESVHKAPVVHYGESKGAGSAGAHAIKQGDTLWDIAQAYNLSMRAIIDANDLHPPYNLAVGERLELPPPQTYTVQKGDNLYRLSRVFDTNTTALARLNNLTPPYTLHEGDQLAIPGGTRNAPGSATRTASSSAAQDVSYPPDKPDRGGGSTKSDTRVAEQSTPARASTQFLRPVEGRVISSYGPKKNGQHNDGINIHAPAGAPVRAAANGRVVYVGDELEGYGKLVLVRHEDRWMSAYAHLDDVLIKRGVTVKRGQSLATVGASGSVSKPQLHFELRRGTKALDPARHLGRSS